MALLEGECLLKELEEILLLTTTRPGQLVLLGGVAGVGKTTVATHLIDRAGSSADFRG